MFRLSISAGVASAMPIPRAFDRRMDSSISLCFLVSRLESSRRSWLKSLGSTMAAAITGPASGPLPTSSHPTSSPLPV